MNQYIINIKNSAQIDLKKLKHSHLKKQFLEIIETLKTDPYQQSQSFEKLQPKHLGRYSRRINQQHRVIYSHRKPQPLFFKGLRLSIMREYWDSTTNINLGGFQEI
ncbi:Txe/YoeB family addiction module toxin [Staphylococcus sp. Marseille-Q6910]|uniref:Txe/YoeB family addiction module toxin n=1 Tax=Staphylococcus sp. Marseille-Q6910 TaxID=2937990 RepID=UPI00203D0FC6|nr:Txe/YoeB family addiction module toxin [Staphylococcus sp. Marseille-Q6910]